MDLVNKGYNIDIPRSLMVDVATVLAMNNEITMKDKRLSVDEIYNRTKMIMGLQHDVEDIKIIRYVVTSVKDWHRRER